MNDNTPCKISFDGREYHITDLNGGLLFSFEPIKIGYAVILTNTSNMPDKTIRCSHRIEQRCFELFLTDEIGKQLRENTFPISEPAK